MTTRTRSGARSRRRGPGKTDAVELVLAICHEVGNLLAAARLSAHLLHDGTPSDGELVAGLEDLAAQAGCLLAHVRPLLVDRPESRTRMAPSDVLDAVRRALQDEPVDGPRLEVEPADGLPDIRVDPDALHHVLVTLARAARAAGGFRRRVVVSARRSPGGVTFVVRGGVWTPAQRGRGAGVGMRGRELALAIARALAKRDRGSVGLGRVKGDAELRLAFPVAATASRR